MQIYLSDTSKVPPQLVEHDQKNNIGVTGSACGFNLALRSFESGDSAGDPQEE